MCPPLYLEQDMRSRASNPHRFQQDLESGRLPADLPAFPGPALSLTLLTLLLLTAAQSALAFNFADLVAETNLAPIHASTESFGNDHVNRFGGHLGYYIPLGIDYPLTPNFSYRFELRYSSSIWHFDDSGGTVAAEPAGRFDSGLGWSLSFGRLLAPSSAENASNFWAYENADGHRSRFFAEFSDGNGSTPGVFYSRDSTYMRLSAGTGGLIGRQIVEFSNGERQIFRQDLVSGDWRLQSHYDTFGNGFTIDYSQPGQKVLTDTHGRVHRIFTRANPAGAGDPVIDRVELAAFGGQTAVWTLAYDSATINRPAQDDDPATAATLAVPRLTSLTRPDGADWSFGYAATGTNGEGRMTAVDLPTLGRYEYDYAAVALPYFAGAEFAADVVGVAERRSVGLLSVGSGPQSGAGNVQGTWTFDYELDIARIQGSIDQPRELTTTVTFPDGHYREHSFSVYVSGQAANNMTPSTNFVKREYGWPITKNDRPTGDLVFPSVRVYDDAGVLLRTNSRRYARSQCVGCFGMQTRLERERVRYHDDSDRDLETVRSDWNGLGHYRVETRTDSVGITPTTTATTDWSQQLPLSTQPWVLGHWTTHSTQRLGETITTEACFDAQTGQQLRSRTRAEAGRTSRDLIRVYNDPGTGGRATIKYYGGDVQTVATGDLCSLQLPSAEVYASFRDYQSGAVSRSGWLAADGSIFLDDYVASIDTYTGLASTAHFGDEVIWAYSYDKLGRRLQSVPPIGAGGTETVTYTAADPISGGLAYQLTVVQEADGSLLSETETILDLFGRPITTSNRTPAGFDTTTRTYNAQDRLASTIDAAGRITSYLEQDAFGRPGRIRPPEGAVHDRVLTYTGDRLTQEDVRIGKQWDAAAQQVTEIDRTITTERNDLGQIVSRVTSDADSTSRTETFTYDARGFLTQSVATDGVRTSTHNQTNRSDYRGFQVETIDGDPITGYDALGHLTSLDTGYGLLNQVFDRAGRLFEQREPAVNNRLWTRQVYATSNAAGNQRKGKLMKRLRVNRNVPHLPNGYAVVEDELIYGGPKGELTELTTSVRAGFNNSMPLFTFSTSQAVDGGGDRTQLTYPDCEVNLGNPNVQCTSLDDRVLSIEREFGLVTSVSATIGTIQENWIDSVTYGPGRFVTGRVLGNGFVESRTADGSGGRLERLTLTHPSSGAFYDSGDAVYDGLGRLVQLGGQRHISGSAYSLLVRQLPADQGPTLTPPSGGARDIFGLPLWRTYTLPIRAGASSQDGEEDVFDIYLYGPGNRLVWSREFNDYDAWSFKLSDDTWHLIGPDGRRLRTRHGLTHYTAAATWANATIDHLSLGSVSEPIVDQIYVDGRPIGTADYRFTSDRQYFFHFDILGRLIATSDQDGGVEQNHMDLF